MFKQGFAKNLKRLRKLRKLTQEQLAEQVGVDFRYISYLENAKSFPSCDLIEKLVKALGVEYVDLFTIGSEDSRNELEKKILNIISVMDDEKLKKLYNIAKEIL